MDRHAEKQLETLTREVKSWIESARKLNELYQRERLRANRLSDALEVIEEERGVLARANVNLAKHIGKLEGGAQ